MSIEQFNDKFEKYIKTEHQDEAKQLASQLMAKRETGQLSKMDMIKNVPKVIKMIKPEYRDQALNLLKKIKK